MFFMVAKNMEGTQIFRDSNTFQQPMDVNSKVWPDELVVNEDCEFMNRQNYRVANY
jgi:hypothetical protein